VIEQLLDFIRATGAANIGWQDVVMIFVGIIFMYLAIKKDWEPYELLPIGLGIIAANLPLTGLITPPTSDSLNQEAGIFGIFFHYGLSFWNILPPIIFLGLGALTDFGPVIANPKTLLLGAAAQIGIFVAFWGALMMGSLGMDFGIKEAASIAIIGGADGPTTIFLSARLAPEILGITAVIAYSYMAAVAFIQPPLMKLFTTGKERQIVMRPLREVSKLEKLIFPNVALIAIILVVPKSAPLIAMFMIGNLFRESGAVPRLTKSASNEILNIATIFLMITVGTQLTADRVFDWQTMVILALGLIAFSCGTIGGILFAKVMNLFLNEKINPLIGSAGVSAVPMAARISHHLGQEANPNNFLLPHAMGPNVAGVIGSAVIAGVFISLVA
jgi:sodium ion-translocating decarboxylase beta subunit